MDDVVGAPRDRRGLGSAQDVTTTLERQVPDAGPSGWALIRRRVPGSRAVRQSLTSRALAVGVLLTAAFLGALPVVVGARWGAVLGVVVVAAVASLTRDLSVRLALMLIPCMALVRRVTAGPDAYVPNDPLVLLVPLLLVPALAGLVAVRLDPALSRPRIAWIGFIAWTGLVTAVIPGASPAVRAYGLLTSLLPAVLGYAVFEGLHEKLPRFAVMSPLVLAPVAALYGLVQYAVDPAWDMAWLTDRQEELISVGPPEPGAYRVFGSMESPGPYAIYLGLGLVALGAVALWSRPSARFRGSLSLMVVAAAVTVAALILSATRSVLFGLPLVAVFAVFLLPRRRRGRLLLVTAVLALGTLVVPAMLADRLYETEYEANRLRIGEVADDRSLEARVDLLDQFSLVLRSPWGTGLGSSGRATSLESGETTADLDNGYLALAQETGVIGLVLFLVLLRTALVEGRRGLERAAADHQVVVGASLLVVIYFAVLLLTGSVLSISSVVIFWVALGALTRLRAEGNTPADRGSPHRRAVRRLP